MPMPRRSCNIFGAVRFMPTSIPTWQTIPKKASSTNPLPSSARHCRNVEASPFSSSSSIFVTPSDSTARIEIPVKIG